MLNSTNLLLPSFLLLYSSNFINQSSLSCFLHLSNTSLWGFRTPTATLNEQPDHLQVINWVINLRTGILVFRNSASGWIGKIIFKLAGNMRNLCAGALLVTLMLPLFTSVEGRFHFTRRQQALVLDSYTHLARKYDRIKEAKIACRETIDSASEMASDDNRAYTIRNHLSFSGGDWDQEPGTTRPLLPYLDYVGYNNSDVSILGSPVKLSGFQLTDVNYDQRSKKTVGVNGVLDLVITRNGFDQTGSTVPVPQFQMWTDYTRVSLFFQGVYTESEENGGERVLCLLGSAKFPVRQSDSSHPWGKLSTLDSMNYQPPLQNDDQILLVIRYPMTFSLTRRAIQGEMRSLSLKTNLMYFDNVRILSQLSTEDYKFDSQAVRKAYDPYPHLDTLLEGGIDFYKGNEFCSLFEAIQRRGNAYIIPNWRCKGADEFCSRLGPFVTDGKKKIGSHGVFADVQLLTQNVHCEQKLIKGKVIVASVSLVLRVVPRQGDFYLESRRSGLGDMTLAAEGVWNSSSGQLCMVGCLGAKGNACDSRVCFYIPTTFTINQRNVLVGSISSMKANTPSYSPLSFEIPFQNRWIWRQLFRDTGLRYIYSKINLAGALMDRDEPSSMGKVIKKSLLNYPKLQENEVYNSSFSLLAEDLTFDVSAVLNPNPSSSSETNFVYMEIFSVGSVLHPSSRAGNFSFPRVQTYYHEKAEYTEKQLLLNVSAQLSIRSVVFSNFSSLFLEGLYNPHVGKMYMIGCRDVRAHNVSETNDLEGGFDCCTEVVISYPPVTGQWLLHPGAQISITSSRPKDDPLYFNPVKLKTRPITYRRQREYFLSERETEGVLRVLTLSVMVVCILLQLLYIRNAADAVPYVSLVMLGIQALGYSLPLITSMESLFKKKNPVTESSYVLESRTGQLDHAIGFTEKLVVLAAFLLTLRLFQKVWKSRVRFLRRVSQEPHRVPNDKLVLVITSVIHLAGFVCILFVHTPNTSQAIEEMQPIDINQDGSFVVSPSSRAPIQWMVLLEEYTGLVQDLFLFPQVVGNLVWQVDTKPLRKLYYIGLSFVRIFPHVYDYFKASMQNPYFFTDYALINRDTDFYSKFSDIFIPVMTVLLAVFVYVQQRWSYYKISDALVLGRCRLLPLRRKVYQKLPSESIEAELASGGHKTNARDEEA